MKFACPKCNTRYSVADTKVPANKVVRFTCKNCGHVIRLKRKAAAPAASPASHDDATQVASLAEINALKRTSAASTGDDGGHEWFILVKGKQQGPMSREKLRTRISRGEVDARNYAWREGMGDWKRLNELAGFRDLASPPPPGSGKSEATVTMDASQLRKALAEAQDDGALSGDTVTMSSQQLRKELAKIEEEQSDPGLRAEPTVTLSAAQLKESLAAARKQEGLDTAGIAPKPIDLNEPTVTMNTQQLKQELAKLQDPTPPPRESPPMEFESSPSGATATAAAAAADADEFDTPAWSGDDAPAAPSESPPQLRVHTKTPTNTAPIAAVAEPTPEPEPAFAHKEEPLTLHDPEPPAPEPASHQRATQEMQPIVPITPFSSEPTKPDAEEPYELPIAPTTEMVAENFPVILGEDVTEPPAPNEYPHFAKAETMVAPPKLNKRVTAPAQSDVIAALTGEPTGDSMMSRDGEHQVDEDDDDDFFDQMRKEESVGARERDNSPFEMHRPAPEGNDGDYLDAPPGEATRIFMATAGIYKRRRRQRVAAVVGSIVTIAVAGVVAGDLFGLYQIPGMGIVYDVTGVEDPNIDRAIKRVETKLTKKDISPEERELLRSKLLGLGTKAKAKPKTKGKTKTADATPTVGIEKGPKLDPKSKKLADDIFGDTRKSRNEVKLKAVSEVQTPNLPEGLTQEAIVKVIEENQRSMGLCIAAALKGGEKLPGKLEVEMTIIATGKVSSVEVNTAEMSEMTACTRKTVKRWKFPRFNGEPVPVSFPFVLSAGI